MDQKCLPSWRNPARYPTSPDADAFVHASHLMGGVHQRGGRRAAHRAAHRGAVGPERSGRSILKLTSLCRCAGPQEAAFCVLRAMRHRGCYGIGGRVFEHRAAYYSEACSYLSASTPMPFFLWLEAAQASPVHSFSEGSVPGPMSHSFIVLR